MNLYFSGGFVYMKSLENEKKLYDLGVTHRLYSYFYLRKKRFGETFKQVREDNLFNIMIDSGAHSVATTKEGVSIEDYGKFLLTLKGIPNLVYINLDVIPHGSSPSPLEFDKSAAEGWENLKYLESLGLNPIHVFHGGEHHKWFNKLVDNYEYIGLAASRFVHDINGRYGFLDDYWKKILDKDGNPIRKVHGFALTSPEIMARYKWFSLDSSTWGQFGVYGKIFLPASSSKRATYRCIDISPMSTARRGKTHYLSLSPEERKSVDEFVKFCGSSSEALLNENVGAVLRDVVNVTAILKLVKEINAGETIIVNSQKSLFEDE
jgi:hypothetical protein